MAKVLRANGMNKCIGCFTCMLTCAAVNKKEHTTFKSAIRVRTTGGLTSSFVSIVCLACTDERACAEACPTGALKLYGKPATIPALVAKALVVPGTRCSTVSITAGWR